MEDVTFADLFWIIVVLEVIVLVIATSWMRIGLSECGRMWHDNSSRITAESMKPMSDRNIVCENIRGLKGSRLGDASRSFLFR